VKSLGSSAVPDRDIVPENRIRGGSDFLGLPGRERSHKGFQLVRKQLGRGRTLRPLPQIQMAEDLADHLRLLDPGDDLHFAAAVGTTKWVDLVNLFEEPGESCDGAGGRNVPHLNPVGEYLVPQPQRGP